MVKEWSPKETLAQILNALSRAEVVCLLLDSVEEREGERMLHRFLYCPEKLKSFSLDEIYKLNFNGQIIAAPDNKFENINHHVI